MKDLYSFACDEDQHQQLYEKVAQSYAVIFKRLGIGDSTYRTYASGGPFSAKYSEEYQTICSFGEDTIFVQSDKFRAINKEILSDETLSELGIVRSDLREQKAVEVGNIFHLGTKYSQPLNLQINREDGSQTPVVMGSYGIGVSRLMGLITELFSDEKGLNWPAQIAPYDVYLISLGNDQATTEKASDLYARLTDAGLEVVYDDRSDSPGEKFADADLWGIPQRIVVSSKTLEQESAELKERSSDQGTLIKLDTVVDHLRR